MHLRSFGRRRHAVLVAVAFALSGIAASGASAAPGGPPNGIFTCGWIAAHSAEALQDHVTCDPSVFYAAMAGKLPGDQAPARRVAVHSSTKRAASSCPFVPNGNRVGQGVFAWSDYFYTTYFNYGGSYSPADYTWYIQLYPTTNVLHNEVYDTGWYQQPGLTYGDYRWGAQNHSSTAQEWQICEG